MGTLQYPPLCARFSVPIVVTGFEPLDLLEGIRRTVVQLEAGKHELENAYPRVVTADGNATAKAVIAEVFEICDRTWRGIGAIPESGWKLAERYASFDAERRFAVGGIVTAESPLCRAGDVLRGAIKPHECSAFGRECTPRTPLGATMVSGEGACAAYYHAGRFATRQGESR
jgi:hydrogenase expression/formation protein HypD